MRDRFHAPFVAPNVAEQMISGKLEVKKGGQLIQELTVFNSDIRGFTAMSEGTKAETIVEMLNEYFEPMVETLFKYEGTLDKFMGDGIMAFWGAPVAHPDDAVRCVQCALDQMEVLGRFNRQRMADHKPPLAVGIGIHTGPGVVGYVGSSKALSYTVIGDTANTSARLCATAAAGQIVLSESTIERIGTRFECEEIDARSLKGNGESPCAASTSSAKSRALPSRRPGEGAHASHPSLRPGSVRHRLPLCSASHRRAAAAGAARPGRPAPRATTAARVSVARSPRTRAVSAPTCSRERPPTGRRASRAPSADLPRPERRLSAQVASFVRAAWSCPDVCCAWIDENSSDTDGGPFVCSH